MKIYLFIYLFIHLFIYFFIYLFIRNSCSFMESHFASFSHKKSAVPAISDHLQDLTTDVALYEPLIGFVYSLRTKFEGPREDVQSMWSVCRSSRCVNEIVFIMTSQSQHLSCDRLQPKSSGQVPSWLWSTVLMLSWGKSVSVYTNVAEKFGLLRKFADLPAEAVVKSAKCLQEAFAPMILKRVCWINWCSV